MTNQTTNTPESIEAKANRLASQVLKGDFLASFIELPLNAKLTGLALFAHIGGDTPMANVCMGLLKEMEL